MGAAAEGINVNFSTKIFLQHPFEPAQCCISSSDPILKLNEKPPCTWGISSAVALLGSQSRSVSDSWLGVAVGFEGRGEERGNLIKSCVLQRKKGL